MVMIYFIKETVKQCGRILGTKTGWLLVTLFFTIFLYIKHFIITAKGFFTHRVDLWWTSSP